MKYALGIDVGTTFSAAAVCTADGLVELIGLGGRTASMPSVVVARADGLLLFGDAAVSRGMVEPTRVAREFKRRLGDPTPLVLGGTPYSAQTLTSLLLRHINEQVVRRMGGPPSSVVITHPASYGAYRIEALASAAKEAGLTTATLIVEPEAAAEQFAAGATVADGELIAVYDFGGGTFDIALLRFVDRRFRIVGTPVGVEHLGGSDFDVSILQHVDDAVGGALGQLDMTDESTLAALARLRQDCRDAKEGLSSDVDAVIPVFVPGMNQQVHLSRKDFEKLIYPRIPETFVALRRALDDAGVTLDDIGRVLLVGGSSRIPMIRERVAIETRRPVAENVDAEHAVALGAARLAALEVPPPPPTLSTPPLVAPPPPRPQAPTPAAPAPSPLTTTRAPGSLRRAALTSGASVLMGVLSLLAISNLFNVDWGLDCRFGGECSLSRPGDTTIGWVATIAFLLATASAIAIAADLLVDPLRDRLHWTRARSLAAAVVGLCATVLLVSIPIFTSLVARPNGAKFESVAQRALLLAFVGAAAMAIRSRAWPKWATEPLLPALVSLAMVIVSYVITPELQQRFGSGIVHQRVVEPEPSGDLGIVISHHADITLRLALIIVLVAGAFWIRDRYAITSTHATADEG